MSKLMRYSINQIVANDILIDKNRIQNSLMFKDITDIEHIKTWDLPTNMYIENISIVGHLYVYVKCSNSSFTTAEIVVSQNPMVDNINYTYFKVFECDRTDTEKAFIPADDYDTLEVTKPVTSEEIADRTVHFNDMTIPVNQRFDVSDAIADFILYGDADLNNLNMLTNLIIDCNRLILDIDLCKGRY